MEDFIKYIRNSIAVKEAILTDENFLINFEKLVNKSVNCINNGGKIFFCGNGGSAADAQHIAAELTGRFLQDRQPIAAIALGTNFSYTTAVANDYSYDNLFSRELQALAKADDILIGISTSGNSANVMNAIKTANQIGLLTSAWTGKNGGNIKNIVDIWLGIPTDFTPHIQEAHITIGHAFCYFIERKLSIN
ncbi:MAG TPA: SIS domain-containing protein [Bacteroidales bacterium]|nr:SIS domain-containing protein [Bacteroidales bacterium]